MLREEDGEEEDFWLRPTLMGRGLFSIDSLTLTLPLTLPLTSLPPFIISVLPLLPPKEDGRGADPDRGLVEFLILLLLLLLFVATDRAGDAPRSLELDGIEGGRGSKERDERGSSLYFWRAR